MSANWADYDQEWRTLWEGAQARLDEMARTTGNEAALEIRACINFIGQYLAGGSALDLAIDAERRISLVAADGRAGKWSRHDWRCVQMAGAVAESMCPQVRATEREKCYRALLDAQKIYISRALI